MESVISKLLEDFEQGKISRRRLVQGLMFVGATSAAGPVLAADSTVLKAISVNHISYQVADYAKTRDFYSKVFGMAVSDDNGKQCRLTVGNTGIIPHNFPSDTPRIDHLAFTIDNWDEDKEAIGADLKRRGLLIRGNVNSSFHIKDPDGFDIQIVGKNYVEKA
jgi:catechol 2,3-dioxygenase-like lactoylglutathione lyase family enzyme